MGLSTTPTKCSHNSHHHHCHHLPPRVMSRAHSSSVFAIIISFCLLLLVSFCDAQEASHNTVIDACALLQKQVAAGNNGSREVTIVASESGRGGASSVSTSTDVQLVNCVIPIGTNLTITVPLQQPRSVQQTDFVVNTVRIEVFNTTMQGGSLQIVPHQEDETPPQSSDLGSRSLRNIHISVDNATLDSDGDLLVVNTYRSSSTAAHTIIVENITMELQNVVLTSSSGSVASIVTGDSSSSVSNAHIRIGGGSAIEARYLLGSVQTSNLTNSSLIATTSMLRSSCIRPIQLFAGGETVNRHVSILSVTAPSNGVSFSDRVALDVKDVEILVKQEGTVVGDPGRSSGALCPNDLFWALPQRQSPSSLRMRAISNVGIAIIASIAVRHPVAAQLTMSGRVRIGVMAILPQDRSSQMAFFASSASDNEVSTQAELASELRAATHGDASISAVGGVAVLTHRYQATQSTAVLRVHENSSLRVTFVASFFALKNYVNDSNGKNLIVNASAHSSGSFTCASLLGITVNSVSSGSSVSNVTVDENSSVALESAVKYRINDSSLGVSTNTSSGSYLASSVCGVAINSYSYTSGSDSQSTLALGANSSLTIGKAVAVENDDNNISPTTTLFSASRGNHLTATVFGLAMNTYSTTRSATVISVSDNSSLAIGSSLRSGGGHISITCPSRGYLIATSVLGIAMNSYSDAFSLTEIGIGDASRLTVGCSATGITSTADPVVGGAAGSIAINTSTVLNNAATSVLGVAMESHPQSSILAVRSSSRVRIQVLLANNNNNTAVGASVKHSSSVAVTAGVLLNGDSNSVLKVVEAFHQPGKKEAQLLLLEQTKRLAIDVWVGLQSRSKLFMGASSQAVGATGEGGTLVLVGLVAKQFHGLTSENTALMLCKDNVTDFPHHVDGNEDVIVMLKTSPIVDDVMKQTTGWQLLQDGSEQPNNSSSNVGIGRKFLCDNRSSALQDTLAEIVPNITTHYHHHVSPQWLPTQTSSDTITTTTTTSSVMSATETLERSASQTVEDNSFTVTLPAPTPNVSSSSAPPLPPKRSVEITNVLLPGDEAAATVVLSTAGASGAVASTLGSSGAGVVVTAGSSVRMMECGLTDDDPRPASFELPIQFPIGGGTTRYFAGAVLSHTLVQVVLFTAPLLLRRAMIPENRANSKLVKYVSLLFCASHPFFTPAILGASATVLFNDDDTLSLAVACVSTFIVATIHAVVTVAVHRGPANGIISRSVRNLDDDGVFTGRVKLEFQVCRSIARSSTTSSKTSTSSSSSNENGSNISEDDKHSTNSDTNSDDDDDEVISSSSDDSPTSTREISEESTTSGGAAKALLFSAAATKDILLTLFDGCRIYEKATHRHYASIETTLYSLIAIISGARPQQNCIGAAFAIGVLAAMQLAYVLLVRPFRTRLDMLFSALNGVVLVVLSMAVAISLQLGGTHSDHEAWMVKTVEACLWLISVLGFVQLGVQGYWAYHVQQRREHCQLDLRRSEKSSADSSSLLSEPLLQVEMVQMSKRRSTNDGSGGNGDHPLRIVGVGDATTANRQHGSNPLLFR